MKKKPVELEELFVPVPFFEHFAVSNYGCVINLETEMEVEPWLSTATKRLKVRFHILGAYIDFFLDELVTEAFFVEYHKGIDIYYRNGNRHDCTVLNLTFDPKYKEHHGEGND